MKTERQALALAIVQDQRALVARLPRASREALTLLKALTERLAVEHGGSVAMAPVRGSAFLFDTSGDALAWAQSVQREALRVPWPAALLNHPAAQVELTDSGSLRFRGLRVAIGIHVDRPDEVGFHHLARLAHHLAPGRLLLSNDAAQTVGGATPAGQVRLGAGGGERPVFEVLLEELDRSFAPVGQVSFVEPSDGRRLFGREGDLSALSELLELGVRAITFQGEPGIGKSRLMLRFGRTLQQKGRQVVHVDLEAALDEYDALHRLARSLRVPLGVRESKSEVVRRIVSAVDHDSVEVISIANVHRRCTVSAVREVVRQVSRATWLVDGERLRILGEVLYQVRALSPNNPSGGDAIRVLDVHGRRIEPRFDLGTGGEAAAIVHELQGNPLALELAAVGLSYVRPLALFERLTARRGPPLRILPIVLDLLEDTSRRMLCTLAVFQGSFDRELALHVSCADLPDVESARRFDGLVNEGLVREESCHQAPGVRRYRLHRQVRSRLNELHPPDSSTVQRLAEGLTERTQRWMAEKDGPRGDRVRARILLDAADIEASALALVLMPVDAHRLRCVGVLFEALVVLETGHLERFLEPLEAALTAVGACLDADPVTVATLFRVRGRVFAQLGMEERAVADLQRSLTLAERWAEPLALARAHHEMGRVKAAEGAFEAAVGSLEQAAASYEEGGRAVEAATVRVHLADVYFRRGYLAEAGDLLDAAEPHLRDHAHPGVVTQLSDARANVHRRLDETGRAEAALREALQGWTSLGAWTQATACRFRLAKLLQEKGELELATSLFIRTALESTRSGDHALLGRSLMQVGLIEMEQGAWDEARATLIRSISAAKAGGDRTGQGNATGFLGLLDHVTDQLTDAREHYRKALRDLESGGGRRFGALFHSCLGAAEAQLGNLTDAKMLVDLAQLQLTDADPGMKAATAVYNQIVCLADADAAEANGDLAEAKGLRDEVARTLESEIDPHNIYVRFAHQHLARLRSSL